MDCNTVETSNEVRSMLIEVGWKKASRLLCSHVPAVLKSSGEVGDNPFTKVNDSITDPISRLQTKAPSENRSKLNCDEQTPGAVEQVVAKHVQHAVNTMEVKADQSQQNAPMNQRDCARGIPNQIQHSVMRIISRRWDAMWHGSCSTAPCRSVTPVSTRLRSRDARNEHDL